MADNKVADALSVATDVVNTGKVVAKIVSGTSINRLAKDSIFQFPCIISSGIDTDEIFIIAKSMEKNYASLIASVMSLRGYVDLRKYDSLVDYLKSFHSNTNVGGTNDISADSLSITLSGMEIATEAKVVDLGLNTLWDSVMEQVDTESLNDMYQPYKRTSRILTEALEASRTNKTIKLGPVEFRNADRFAADVNADSTPLKSSTLRDKDGKAVYPRTIETDADGEVVLDNRGNPKYNVNIANGPLKEIKNKDFTPRDNRAFATVVRDDAISNMTPTIVNLSFVMQTKEGNSWTQNAVIGIRAMVRQVRPSLMVANMVEAAKDRAVFKFLSWTKGEFNTLDFVFGTKSAKKDALDSVNKEKWLSALKARRKAAGFQKVFGKRLLPNATIIVTESEALDVKASCGVDLHKESEIQKIMKKYFLLGFGIYDTEGKVLDFIADGDSDYSSYSERMLIAQNKKETNLLAMNKY